MGLFGPSKAELTAAAETCAADTDRNRCAARTARDARLRAVDYRERATDRFDVLPAVNGGDSDAATPRTEQ